MDMKTDLKVLGVFLVWGLMISLVLLSTGACGAPKSNVVVAPYHESSLQNMVLGREYMAQGRFELAREHMLLALCTARDPEQRERLAREVEAADKMIQTLR